MPKEASTKKDKPETIKPVIDKSMIDVIKNRQTEELVIAFCGPLGSGTTAVANEVIKIIKEYDYEINIIKVSKLISLNKEKVQAQLKEDKSLKDIDLNKPTDDLDAVSRIIILQSIGNLLRKIISRDVLAQLIIFEIVHQRLENIKEEKVPTEPKRESRRFVTIVDSLKHPDEVSLLRAVYGNMFHLFGVLCPEDLRKNRLINKKGIDSANAGFLMERDKSEDEKYGQQLLKTIFHSDFFVRNTKDNINSLKPNLERFIKLILGESPLTPTKEESAMYFAQSAAVRSACLSRQVGASIINDNGELISTGCNDVPKYGGGLYSVEDGTNDNRCMNLYGNKCQNDDIKERIFKDIDEILKKELEDLEKIGTISELIRTHDRLNGLIEFCRAIHAEMDAITSASREGRLPLKGTSLFCTTFPCHNCARHIIASGIKAVYYIEPYEKSLALKLHEDAIEFDPDMITSTNNQKKVAFIPFEGVAPRRYLSLFQAKDRKVNGKKVEIDLKTAKPVIAQLLDTYLDYESKIVDNLVKLGFSKI